MEGKVIDFNEYKRRKGIALPRSPYYTLNATKEEVQYALQRAAEELEQPHGGQMLYAALVGYEDKKTGRVKLLKQMQLYSNREVFERSAGIRGYRCIGLARNAQSAQ